MAIVTLTTDFGLRDWFVGSMRGVMLGINPSLTIVDLTHEISSGDISAAALSLMASYRTFPAGTIHVAVVDPGVGSDRNPLVADIPDHRFIGPDNGLFTLVLAGQSQIKLRRLDDPKWQRHPVCPTFHGRDIFAPAAAHLSRGISLQAMGSPLADYIRLDWPEPEIEEGVIRGQVIHIDRFGNAITNIPAGVLESLNEGPQYVATEHQSGIPLKAYYQQVPAQTSLALVGSAGLVELATNGDRASDRLDLKIGSTVTLFAR